MTIDEMKNKISMKLGGTDTQLGFEVICKKLMQLEKENTELKTQISKYEETIDIEQDLNKDAAGEIELYQQENAELKKQLYNLQSAYTLTVDKSVIREQELEAQNEKLKQILFDVLDLHGDLCQLCKNKGQVLPQCNCVSNEDCFNHILELYKEKK